MKKWFACMQGQQCPRSQGHGQEEGRRNQCPCLALTEPHLDIAQLGAHQHRHNHEPEGPKGTGAGAAALGEGCRSRAGSDGLRGTGAPCTPSGHSEGPETTDGNVNEGDSECVSEKPFPPKEGEAAAQVALGAWSDLAPAPVAAGRFPRAGFPRTSILVLSSLVGIQFLLLCAFSTPASCKVSSTATTLVSKPCGAVMVRSRLHFCSAGIPESSPHIFHNSLPLSLGVQVQVMCYLKL